MQQILVVGQAVAFANFFTKMTALFIFII